MPVFKWLNLYILSNGAAYVNDIFIKAKFTASLAKSCVSNLFRAYVPHIYINRACMHIHTPTIAQVFIWPFDDLYARGTFIRPIENRDAFVLFGPRSFPVFSLNALPNTFNIYSIQWQIGCFQVRSKSFSLLRVKPAATHFRCSFASPRKSITSRGHKIPAFRAIFVSVETGCNRRGSISPFLQEGDTASAIYFAILTGPALM